MVPAAGGVAERKGRSVLVIGHCFSIPAPSDSHEAGTRYVDNPTCARRTTVAARSGLLLHSRARFQRKIRRVTTDKTKTFDLSASFKAYDVRGIVGESITAEIVEAVGAAFVDVLELAGPDRAGGRRHAPLLPRVQQGLRQRRRHPRRQRPAAGPDLHRRALLRLRCPQRRRRHVHREPQPRRIQRHQDGQGRRRADLLRNRAQGNPGPRRGIPQRRLHPRGRQPAA